MKNYSLDFKERKTFILNYDKDGNQIIVHLASGEEYYVPNTPENEKIILERMRKQVMQADDFTTKQKKRFSSAWKWAIWSGFWLAFNSIVLATGTAAYPVLTGICEVIFIFDVPYEIYRMVDSKRNLKDLHKNLMFLNNEELLNKKVKSNQNILSKTSEKTKELVASAPENKPVFSLNNMDKIKYEELRKIWENIERDEEFGFDYSNTPEGKPMELTKKRNDSKY